MDGFKRQKPNEPIRRSPNVPLQQSPPAAVPVLIASDDVPEALPQASSTGINKTTKRLIIGFGLLLAIFVIVCASWYSLQLRAVDATDNTKQQFVVKEGESFGRIAKRLKTQELIRSELAIDIAGRVGGQRAAIKAGTCSLSPSQSSNEILAKLIEGCHDFKAITFYPGATIEKPFYKSPSATLSQTLYVKNILKEAGYDERSISKALSATYESPLFAGKPASATLEGYIYGETYYVDTDANAETVLRASFDEMYKVVTKYNLPSAYTQQGLQSLYEGITMASIVQRELNCEDKPTPERKDRCFQYQRNIAQVLLKRLAEGIPLGADVTFIYAADMAGMQPTIDFDSPYNTRTQKGLPPGPIGTPGELALRAVADPSDTDYLYFVAGDDGLIYFSKTQAEHEKNTVDHCKKLCFELN